MSSQNHHMTSRRAPSALRILPWLICGLAAIFYCYEYFLRVAPSVMIPDLMKFYGLTSGVSIGYLIAYYYHLYTPMQIPIGMLMDRYGPRRLLTLACLACAVGSYLFAATHSVSIAAIGRLLVGFGSAFAFIGVLKLARAWLPDDYFAMISGLTSALGIVGALIGDIFLTSMVEKLGWQQATFLSAIVGIILAVVIYLVIRDKDPQNPLETEAVVHNKQVIKDFIHLLAKPEMWLIGLVGCLLYLPTSSFAELWGVPYFTQAWHFTPQEAGYAVSTIFIGWGIAAPIAGLISDKLHHRCKPMFIGGIVGAILISLLIYAPSMPKPLVFILLFFFGASYSVEVIVFAYACDIAPWRSSGTALAITNMLVMLGGSLFQPIIGKLLDIHSASIIENGVRVFSQADFRFALSVLPISLICASILVMFLKEPSKKVGAL